MSEDSWKHRAENMSCSTCMWFVSKEVLARFELAAEPVDPKPGRLVPPEKITLRTLGLCRRHAPCKVIIGWPAVWSDDWCGDHKLDENKT